MERRTVNIVTFRDLSIPLKTVVVLVWTSVALSVLLWLLFVIALAAELGAA